MTTFDEAVKAGKVSSEEATAIFDALEPIPVEFMIGLWKGSEFPTGHPVDGKLAATGWYGKRFKDAETGDPLLFYAADGKNFFAADPKRVTSGEYGNGKLSDHQAELETDKPTSRLRMVELHGKSTASMIYDELPIIDHFRKVDGDTVLGAMDLRGTPQTYFFVLRRVRD